MPEVSTLENLKGKLIFFSYSDCLVFMPGTTLNTSLLFYYWMEMALLLLSVDIARGWILKKYFLKAKNLLNSGKVLSQSINFQKHYLGIKIRGLLHLFLWKNTPALALLKLNENREINSVYCKMPVIIIYFNTSKQNLSF